MKAELKRLREKDEKGLREELLKLLREQFNLRMQSGEGSKVRAHQFKQVRRSIARVRTLLKEKSEVV